MTSLDRRPSTYPPETIRQLRLAPTTNPWPGLYDVPTGRRAKISAAITRRIFDAATRRLGVSVVVDRGAFSTSASSRTELDGPVIVLHRPEEFFARVGRDGLIGFGEGYLTRAWDSPDLDLLLTHLAGDLAGLVPGWMQSLRATWAARPPQLHRNTVDHTRDNIAHHYDLSNDLFSTFLDETLSYSSALFDTEITSGIDRVSEVGQAVAPSEDQGLQLATAQARKIERLLDQCHVGHGTRLLEIGTGWGELAIRAAGRGAIVRSVTLSSEQKALAEKRIAEAGLTDQITVDLSDYREVQGRYDAVVSVEMIEAVGHEYWSTYFGTIDRLLAPGGRVGIQAITMPHDRMKATKSTYTWINKYIFPGGFLPSTEALDQVTRADTKLRIVDRLSFGTHYAETLRLWDEAFMAAGERVSELGFDETFRRMWHFYLIYSRAGFASGYLDVQQLTLTRGEA